MRNNEFVEEEYVNYEPYQQEDEEIDATSFVDMNNLESGMEDMLLFF